MPRSKNPVPSYSLHKPTGQAYVRLPDGNGGRRVVYLGKYGSPSSQAEYRRLLAEMEAQPAAVRHTLAAGPTSANLTVSEVLLAFMQWAATHYRTPDGEPTNEIVELRQSARPVRELYGHTPAREFGPKALATVRQRLIDAGLCRTLINRRMDRVKRVFKWATSQELVPVTVYQSLRTLAGLQKGRTAARESERVEPVDPAHVDATLPYLTPHLRTMVELQRLTGMRPGEVCRLKLAEVERIGESWTYRPDHHKTAHRGRPRVIPLGPKARAALVAFLLRDGTPPHGFGHLALNDPSQSDARRVMADAYEEAGRVRDAELLRDVTRRVMLIEGCVVDPAAPLFSPAESREEWARAARANRKSKVPPSQQNRRKVMLKRRPGSVYKVTAYGHAVRKAAEKANVPHWHLNQLRHTFATQVRSSHGLEAAQVLLGHAKADVTQVYAERNEALAASVAAKIG
jgi:integrase